MSVFYKGAASDRLGARSHVLPGGVLQLGHVEPVAYRAIMRRATVFVLPVDRFERI